MLKPAKLVCPAVTAVLLVGAFFLVQGGEAPDVRLSSPVLIAMQASRPAASQPAPHLPLSNVGWIGVMLDENKAQGVRVTSVFPGGPAALAGVRVGDILLRVADVDLVSTQNAEAAIERLVPQKRASLKVMRAGRAVELKVIPGSLAEFKQDYINEMMRRDPRDPKYGMHHGISEADIQAELVRRLFEQHERLDRSLHEVLKELQALRQEVATLKDKR